MNELINLAPLVSVIIPCYNHGNYLSNAIESVLNQTYDHVEIIVIDDGSVDDTAMVAKKYDQIIYYYQKNQGLSASRNRGVEMSKGDYIIFLDADDWLLPDAIQLNLQKLKQNPLAALVSGGHIFYYQPEEKKWEIFKEVELDHYKQMLMGNYIGMPSVVMYQRWTAVEFPFNTSLKNCEDYEQYFRILRKHPVIHHTGLIAVYRNHGNNKSGNIPVQLETALMVLEKQEPFLKNEDEKESWKTGIHWLKEYYCKKLLENLLHRLYTTKEKITKAEKKTLEKYRPELYQQYRKAYKGVFKSFWIR